MIGLLFASAVPTKSAQDRAKQHRIVFIIPSGRVVPINDPGGRFYQAFW
jgi:hypothetical protein